MTTEIYLRAYPLFQAASELSPEQRSLMIRAATLLEPDLAAAVNHLLSVFDQNNDRDPGVAVDLPRSKVWEGAIVGRWLIQGLLQHGGFGSVYLARAEDAPEQQVAIKFLDLAPFEETRFHQERQVLVDLDHKSICKFIDGGVHAGHTQYLVMEYVCGSPMTEYCDAGRLNVFQRLELFQLLCGAIEYAHQRWILHRDIKPSNVLVRTDGSICVLDFGLAKLLDHANTVDQPLTRPGMPLGTRVYSAPEQVRGDAVSLASDVYSLGVLLYCLTTGHAPFSDAALRERDWMRIVQECNPSPPSEIQATQTQSHVRGTTPRGLRRILSGNLDAIILKALARDPNQRYPYVELLRTDVQRFLEGRAVSVRRAGLWERLRNWSVRNKAVAVTVGVAALWIVASLVRLPTLLELRGIQQEEEDLATKLGFLLSEGIPGLKQGLARSSGSLAERRQLNAIYTALLARIPALEADDPRGLERGIALGAVECAREWMELGDPTAMLSAVAPLVPRFAARFDADPHDQTRRDDYAALVRLQLMAHTQLGQRGEALRDAALLANLETARR